MTVLKRCGTFYFRAWGLVFLGIFIGCAPAYLRKPLSGASALELEPTLTKQERIDVLEAHAMGIATQTTITRSDGGSSIKVDETLLTQGETVYEMSEYLPVLHAEGIAKNVEAPQVYTEQAKMVDMAWIGGGLLAGTALLMAQWIEIQSQPVAPGRDEKELAAVGTSLLVAGAGFVGGQVHSEYIRKPVYKIRDEAKRKRIGWIRDFNEGLIGKLGLSPVRPTIKALPLVSEAEPPKKKKKNRKRRGSRK